MLYILILKSDNNDEDTVLENYTNANALAQIDAVSNIVQLEEKMTQKIPDVVFLNKNSSECLKSRLYLSEKWRACVVSLINVELNHEIITYVGLYRNANLFGTNNLSISKNCVLKPEELLLILEENSYLTTKDGLYKKLFKILTRLGIHSNLLGYDFLISAISKSYENPKTMKCMQKSLYPLVALEYDTTTANVERMIRYAINVAYQRGRIQPVFNSICGMKCYNKYDKPTNCEFISFIVDSLRFSDYSEI